MNHLNLYEVLTDLVIENKPASYLEIGVQEGLSLSTVLKADTPKSIDRVSLCDNWGPDFGGTSKGNHEHIHNVLRSVKFEGEVNFYDGDSKITVPKIAEKFDLVLVDGDHSEHGCLIDMENSWELLNQEGHMVVDDIIHPAHAYLMAVVSMFVGMKSDEVESVTYHTEKPNGVAVIKKVRK